MMTRRFSRENDPGEAAASPAGRRRGRLAKLGLLIVSLAVGLIAVEIGLRFVPALRVGEIPVLTQYDSSLGWSLIPDTAANIHTREFEANEWINSLGLRGDEVPAQRAPNETRILLLGDSFVEGYTVDDGATVDVRLRRVLGDPSVRVFNAGTRGWSTDQELLFFLDNAERLDPDVTVLFFYVNDVCFNARDRYWRGGKPRFRVEADTLTLPRVAVPPPPPPPPPPARSRSADLKRRVGDLAHRSMLVRLAGLATRGDRRRSWQENPPLERAGWSKSPAGHPCLADGWELSERLIVRLRDEVSARGGDFLVFWVPSKEAVYDEDWERLKVARAIDPSRWSPTADADRLGDICERNALRCVIPLTEFRIVAGYSVERLYFEVDPHWTAAGHALAARVLGRAVRARIPKLSTPAAVVRRWP